MNSILKIVLFSSLVCMKLAAGAKEKSVNLNLETVLEFNNKDLDSDVKIIDDVQEFLSKVRNVLDTSKHNNNRRSFNNDEEKNLKFTDFLEYVINHLLTYNDKELEEIAVIIDEEIRKYHYKGCKFYELVENNDEFRDYVTEVLERMKHLKGKYVTLKRKLNKANLKHRKLRKLFKHYVKKIKAKDLQKKDLDLILYINSLYRVDSKDKMNNFIKEFSDFSKSSRRNHKDLVKVIRKGLRSMVFDHYSNLNANARKDLKMKVSSYLIEYKADKKDKGKTVTYGTITEIEYVPTKSVKEKSKHGRHGRHREHKTTESDNLMITPSRDLEEEKKMMPFRFISLYTEEIPTTTKKPKTTKKKRRRHKHKENKPDKKVKGHSLLRERVSETISQKAEKFSEHDPEDSKKDYDPPEQKKDFKSEAFESPSEEKARFKTNSKKPRAKSGQPKTVMVVREDRPLREILTEHNAIIRVMSSQAPQQVPTKGLNRALRKIKKNREDKINIPRHTIRVKPVDLVSNIDSSEEKILVKKPSDSIVKKPKAKIKFVARDAIDSKTEKHFHVEEEKPIKVSKKTHKKTSVHHGSKKSKQHEVHSTVNFLQRAKVFDTSDEHMNQNLKGPASIKQDFSRKEQPGTFEVEEVTVKDRHRKSLRDVGLPIESFENNVLDGYYEYRKQNQNYNFKSNKRSLLRKINKEHSSRAREFRYRKNLPMNEINKIEDTLKSSTVSEKTTVSKSDVTKKLPALQTKPLKLDDQTPLTNTKANKKTNNDTKVTFRSRYSGEKTEPSTVAFVSDNYIINKISNLEKQLEVVIDKIGERKDRAKHDDSIEQTTKYQQIPYWIGTPKTTRPSSSSSSSSEESSENGTVILSNNITSANLATSRKSNNTPAVSKSDAKLSNATIQENNTSNNLNGTAVEILKENLSDGNNSDGRKQGLHADKSGEITNGKVDSQTANLNVSITTSVEKEGTIKSDNPLATANIATSTTKDDTSDKTSKEPFDTAKFTKEGVNFRASKEDPREDKKSTMKSKSIQDKTEQFDKEAKITKNEIVKFSASKGDLKEGKKSAMKSISKNDKTEQSDKEAKSTKKDTVKFSASEDDLKENKKTTMNSKSKNDKTEQFDKGVKSIKKETINFNASEDYLKEDKKSTMKSNPKKDKNDQSEKGAKSTKKETYFRASENNLNEDIISKNNRNPIKDNPSTKIVDSSSTLKLSSTATTFVKTTKIKTNETVKQDINSTNVNATKEHNDQTTMLTDTTLANKSTTISTKHGMKFTFSIANVNITSGSKGIEDISKNNSSSKKSRRMGRRRNVYAKSFDSDNDRLKTDREMDDALYNWA